MAPSSLTNVERVSGPDGRLPSLNGSHATPSVGPKLFRSLFHMPPFEKLTVVGGIHHRFCRRLPGVEHRHERQVVVFPRRAKYSHFRPARTVTFDFHRQLSWMNSE